MSRKFSELRRQMSADAQARSKARAGEMLQDMALAELRRAQELTQQDLARTLKVNQAWISKVERQTDMYLSTLRAYIKAMGGHLEIIAYFDDCTVRINQLNEQNPKEQGIAPKEGPSEEPGFVEHDEGSRHVAVWTQQSPEATVTDSLEYRPQIWKRSNSNQRTPSSDTSSPTSKAA